MNTDAAIKHLRAMRNDQERYLSHSKNTLVRQRIQDRIEAIDKAIEALQLTSLVKGAGADA